MKMENYIKLNEGHFSLIEPYHINGQRLFKEYVAKTAKQTKSADIYIDVNWFGDIYITYIPNKVELLENSLFLYMLNRYVFNRRKIIHYKDDDVISVRLIAEKSDFPKETLIIEEQFNEYLSDNISNGEKEFKFEVWGDLRGSRFDVYLGKVSFSVDYVELI